MEDENDNRKEVIKDLEKDLCPSEEKRKKFGQRLRELREERELSRRSVAHATKISEQFILSLEKGDFEFIPGRIFGYGFLKSILSLYQVDSEKYCLEYNSCWESQSQQSEQRKSITRVVANALVEGLIGLFRKINRRKNHRKPYMEGSEKVPLRRIFSGVFLFLVISTTVAYLYFLGGHRDPELLVQENIEDSVSPGKIENSEYGPFLKGKNTVNEVIETEESPDDVQSKSDIYLVSHQKTRLLVRVHPDETYRERTLDKDSWTIEVNNRVDLRFPDPQGVKLYYKGQEIDLTRDVGKNLRYTFLPHKKQGISRKGGKIFPRDELKL